MGKRWSSAIYGLYLFVVSITRGAIYMTPIVWFLYDSHLCVRLIHNKVERLFFGFLERLFFVLVFFWLKTWNVLQTHI